MPPEWKYFRPEEVGGLNEEFVAKLDQARHLAGIPFTITSGFRTVSENESLVASGAAPHSSHLQGLAVDLRVQNDYEIYRILSSGMAVGITRYGIYTDADNKPTHVHLDVSKDDAHVPEVIWIKREGQAGPIAAT